MYDRVLVITINLYYSKIPSTGTAVLLRSTVPTTVKKLLKARCNLRNIRRLQEVINNVIIVQS